MSGRAAPIRHRTRLLLWGCGLIAACAAAAVPAAGQEPDDRSPLPAEPATAPPAAAKYQLPDRDHPRYTGSPHPDPNKKGERVGGIQDEKELASEKKNGDEYMAFAAVLKHAAQFPAAELEVHAAKGLIRLDLVHPNGRGPLRLALVRMDGTLTRVRRIEPSESLRIEGVTAAYYQGWLTPADEPASRPVCVVFAELPPGIPAPARAEEWVAVGQWVRFAGYSFKLMSYPGPNADPKRENGPGWLTAPLLIGSSVSPAAEPPPSVALDPETRVFQRIVDDAPLPGPADNNWEEAEAWNRVLLHARKFAPEQLDAAARTDLGFADLFKDVRRDYKLKLVRFEGRLIGLRRLEPTARLAEAGLEAVYEGWLIPKDEPAGNPVCVVVTELPPGLDPQPAGRSPMNRSVAVTGYSFKLMRYESRETDKTEKNRNVVKRAPYLIGRTIAVLDDPEGAARYSRWSTFVTVVFGGLLLLIGTAVVLAWWFRRGDRAAKAEMTAVRNRNPFSE